MPLSLPRLAISEWLTSSTWNTAMTLLETEFTLPVTLNWPLQAGGAIDMLGNEILNVPKFWKVYNAAEYASWQDVLDAVAADGQGCIVIPPNTTILANAATLNADDVLILGYGPSSVLKALGGAGDHIMSSTGDSRLQFANMTVDVSTFVNFDGINIDGGADIMINNCWFKGVGSANRHALQFTGAATNNINISNCPEMDGIELHDANRVTLDSVIFTGDVDILHAIAGDKGSRITFDGCSFESADLTVTNTAGSTDDNYTQLGIKSCELRDSNVTIDLMRRVSISDTELIAGGNSGAGIVLTDCEKIRINDVDLHGYDSGYGMSIVGGTNLSIDNLGLHGCGDLGTNKASFYASGITTLFANNLRIFNAKDDAIEITGDFGDIRLDNPCVNGAANRGLFIDYTTPTTCQIYISNPFLVNITGQSGDLVGSASATKSFSCQGGFVENGILFATGPYSGVGVNVGPHFGSTATDDQAHAFLHGKGSDDFGAPVGVDAAGTFDVTVPGLKSSTSHILIAHSTHLDFQRIIMQAHYLSDDTVRVYWRNVSAGVGTSLGVIDVYVTAIPTGGVLT